MERFGIIVPALGPMSYQRQRVLVTFATNFLYEVDR